MIKYSQLELDYLRKTDPKLGELFDKFGIIKRKKFGNVFQTLVNSVAGQQISSKAQVAIMKRIEQLAGKVSPEKISELDFESLKACGLSAKKTQTLKDCASLFLQKKLSDAKFKKMSEQEFIETLTSIKGVGIWTAEMLMIFSLGKADIFSYSDLGIRRGLSVLHNIEKIDKNTFEKFRTLYSPYATVASIYLWELANNTKI